MKHILRILAAPIILALFASCNSSVREASQDSSTEIEALIRAEWQERRLVLITSVPDYHALFEWDNSGQLLDGRHWGAAHVGDFLTRFTRMQIKTRAKLGRRDLDDYRALATPDCIMNKEAGFLGLEDFADCIQHVSVSCDAVIYSDSEDLKTLEAYDMNLTYNDDNTALAVPCSPPGPWKG